MKNKGFTLIELLAVIVILAIIALIAVPIVLNIINDTRDESNKRSVELYAKSVQQALAKQQTNYPNSYLLSGEFTISENGKKLVDPKTGEVVLEVEFDGNINCSNNVVINTDGTIKMQGCQVNGAGNYNYGVESNDSGTLYTGVIYRNSSQSLYIGSNIEGGCSIIEAFTGESFEACSEKISYETDPVNISKNNYLKHEVVNNIITASYACITYTENGTRKDICLGGADPSYYTMNQEKFHSVESYFKTLKYKSRNGYCEFYYSDFRLDCYSDSLGISTNSGGHVDAIDASVYCSVNSGGLSHCIEY